MKHFTNLYTDHRAGNLTIPSPSQRQNGRRAFFASSKNISISSQQRQRCQQKLILVKFLCFFINTHYAATSACQHFPPFSDKMETNILCVNFPNGVCKRSTASSVMVSKILRMLASIVSWSYWSVHVKVAGSGRWKGGFRIDVVAWVL